MAITKIHPIKSTLKKALDYIENPEKTEDKMLVSSFGCSYETGLAALPDAVLQHQIGDQNVHSDSRNGGDAGC